MMQRLRFFCLLLVLGFGFVRSTVPAASAQPATRIPAPVRVADEKSFLVYPNPSNGIVHIAINGFEGRRLELRILNVIGTVIYRESLTELTGPKTLDLSKFASGLYYVKLEGENASEMRKLVIR
ncbi:T9SS type A sorting domain-containing protein [Hymenobacter metallicola]|uniref:T9SS type A sorting domain-containing protein n=1 Tax=Hymenobacter metallicola TaxID=2563114 RepID=A0A4Z0QBD8_9BACT|nr:T9SS type A sorting domain-containing protein [Hymenobacter metallicola]TGE27397.1 T9SS type A sorting domain-containing protein [Hymenobacter metallicola]